MILKSTFKLLIDNALILKSIKIPSKPNLITPLKLFRLFLVVINEKDLKYTQSWSNHLHVVSCLDKDHDVVSEMQVLVERWS